jgi:hypothetical protein
MPEDRRIAFRIGINIGDVIIEEGDVYATASMLLPQPCGRGEPDLDQDRGARDALGDVLGHQVGGAPRRAAFPGARQLQQSADRASPATALR